VQSVSLLQATNPQCEPPEQLALHVVWPAQPMSHVAPPLHEHGACAVVPQFWSSIAPAVICGGGGPEELHAARPNATKASTGERISTA